MAKLGYLVLVCLVLITSCCFMKESLNSEKTFGSVQYSGHREEDKSDINNGKLAFCCFLVSKKVDFDHKMQNCYLLKIANDFYRPIILFRCQLQS